MKPESISPIFSATAIALGVTAVFCQPSQAANYDADYDDGSSWSYSYDDTSYSDRRLQLPDLDRAYRSDAPTYHYAYYSIARPEYLL
ncbi:MAG: hypothetical protein DCF22_17275 [Leptolyngbya sp.]|nr:MAG: hypothetical protein DCF22_17275 [Leptolyngbya sp.]